MPNGYKYKNTIWQKSIINQNSNIKKINAYAIITRNKTGKDMVWTMFTFTNITDIQIAKM